MYKVAVISDCNEQELEYKINKWLGKKKDLELLDIRFSTTQADMTALILYKV